MEKILTQQKELYIQEISKCSEEISNNQTKISKFGKIIDEKFEEIERLKPELEILGQTEEKSKNSIKLVIRKVTEVLNGLELLLRNVQKQMMTNVKSTVRKSTSGFKKLVDNLEKMEDFDELLKQIDNLEHNFRSGNNETLKLFQKEIRDFENGIIKVMDVLSPAIKKLQLNLSLKKFEDFWAIYDEINKCVDQIGEWSRTIAKIGSEKIYKVVVLQDLEAFGLQKDLTAMTEMLNLWEGKTTESEELLSDLLKGNTELKLNLDSIESEWKRTRLHYQEKVNFIELNIKQALSQLDSAQSTLQKTSTIIQENEATLTTNAEQKISTLMEDLRKKIQGFASVFGKSQKVQDEKKRELLQSEIKKKFDQFAATIQFFFDGLLRELTSTYSAHIEQIRNELNTIIKDILQNLRGIRSSIDNLQIASSKEILLDLLELSQLYVKTHQKLVEGSENEMMYHTFISNATKKVQELRSTIDRLFGIHQAKLSLMQTTNASPKDNLPVISWEIMNPGRIGFSDLDVGALLPSYMKKVEFTPQPIVKDLKDANKIGIWKIPKLDRQETQVLKYQVQQIASQTEFFKADKIIAADKQQTQDIDQISSLGTNVYRNSGKATICRILESNGQGVVEISNPSEKTPLWNIIIGFQTTDNSTEPPFFATELLGPGENKQVTYRYTKPQSLTPIAFHAEIPLNLKINLTKVKEKSQTYACEMVIENTSDFLIYGTKFSVFPIEDPSHPLISFDHLNNAPIEPGFTYAKSDELQSIENPPQIAIEFSHTVQLFYEYALPTSSLISAEAPSGDASQQKAIQLIEETLTQLNDQKEALQAILTSIEAQILEKEAERKELINMEKIQSPAPTAEPNTKTVRSLKDSKKPPKATKKK